MVPSCWVPYPSPPRPWACPSPAFPGRHQRGVGNHNTGCPGDGCQGRGCGGHAKPSPREGGALRLPPRPRRPLALGKTTASRRETEACSKAARPRTGGRALLPGCPAFPSSQGRKEGPHCVLRDLGKESPPLLGSGSLPTGEGLAAPRVPVVLRQETQRWGLRDSLSRRPHWTACHVPATAWRWGRPRPSGSWCSEPMGNGHRRLGQQQQRAPLRAAQAEAQCQRRGSEAARRRPARLCAGPMSPSRSQPIAARAAPGILKTHPLWTTGKLSPTEVLDAALSVLGLAVAHLGPLPRASLPLPAPTLSRKRQGFSSINTSVGGELWGPQEPQAGLVASKLIPELAHPVRCLRRLPEAPARPLWQPQNPL